MRHANLALLSLRVMPGVIKRTMPHFLIKYAACKLSSAKFKGATPARDHPVCGGALLTPVNTSGVVLVYSKAVYKTRGARH